MSQETPTLMEHAYRLLEEKIVTLEIEPGSVVSEASLSRLIGIGTTPIREALQRLAREHLVQILPRRGVIVSRIDLQQQLEVLEVRRELDRLTMRNAARRATSKERAAFSSLADRMAQVAAADDVEAFLRLDREFNDLTALAARNAIARETVASLQPIARRFWFFYHPGFFDTRETAALHIEVLRSIVGGDQEAAAKGAEHLIDQMVRIAKETLISD